MLRVVHHCEARDQRSAAEALLEAGWARRNQAAGSFCSPRCRRDAFVTTAMDPTELGHRRGRGRRAASLSAQTVTGEAAPMRLRPGAPAVVDTPVAQPELRTAATQNARDRRAPVRVSERDHAPPRSSPPGRQPRSANPRAAATPATASLRLGLDRRRRCLRLHDERRLAARSRQQHGRAPTQ
jgi:hypothetical protein